MPRLRRSLIILIFVLPFCFYCGINSLIYGAIYAPNHKKICCETPSDWGFEYQDVAFTSRGDKLILRGWLIPSQNGVTIITLHGYGGTRLNQDTVIQWLAEAGYGVLAYDMRGSGESDGNWRSYGWRNVADVQGAVDFLQTETDDQIGIWGHSVGGQVATRATAQIPEIQALVLDGVSTAFYADTPALAEKSLQWRLRTYDLYIMNHISSWFLLRMPIPDGMKVSLEQIAPRPVLLIGGTANEVEAVLIRDFYDVAGEPKTLLEFSDVGHGGTWRGHPEEYKTAILEFYDAAFSLE